MATQVKALAAEELPEAGTEIEVLWATSTEEEEESETDSDGEEDLKSESENEDDTVLKWCKAMVLTSKQKDVLPNQRLIVYAQEENEETDKADVSEEQVEDAEEVVFVSKGLLVLLADYEEGAPADSYAESGLQWRLAGKGDPEVDGAHLQGAALDEPFKEMLRNACANANLDELLPGQDAHTKLLAAEKQLSKMAEERLIKKRKTDDGA